MVEFAGPGGTVVLGPSTGVPPPNFQQQAEAYVKGLKDSGIWADFWSIYHAARHQGHGVTFSLFLAGVDDYLIQLAKLYGYFESADNPGLNKLASVIVGDLLGVEYDSATAGFGRGGASNRSGNISLGSKFLEILTSLIGTQVPLTAQGGWTAAQGFLGFLISFAIREANVDVISSLIPEEYRFGDEVKEYGAAVSRNLGMGRLARMAFAPLINVLVADPLKWYLNQQYRPTLMKEGELIRSQVRGLQLDPDFATQMHWLGYSDNNIAALIEDNYQRPPASDLFLL